MNPVHSTASAIRRDDDPLMHIYALAVSPDFQTDHTIFAASQSGLYRSMDGGQTWQYAYASLELAAPLPTTTLALSPGFVSDGSLFAGVSGGVLRSTDRGGTWQVAVLPSPGPTISALAVSPAFQHDGVILAGSVEDGIWRSADRGGRWSAWNFGLLDLNVTCVAISPAYTDDQTIYAGTESGLFRSTNGGRAWRAIDLPAGYDAVLCLAPFPDFAQSGRLLVGTQGGGLFCFADRTGQWVRLGADRISSPVNTLIVAPQPDQPARVLAVLDDVFLISRDGGYSWSAWNSALTIEHPVSSVAAPYGLEPSTPLYFGSMGGGISICQSS